jgi:hypothetical protein
MHEKAETKGSLTKCDDFATQEPTLLTLGKDFGLFGSQRIASGASCSMTCVRDLKYD